MRRSDSGNYDADTLIFSYCKDKILCSNRKLLKLKQRLERAAYTS